MLLSLKQFYSVFYVPILMTSIGAMLGFIMLYFAARMVNKKVEHAEDRIDDLMYEIEELENRLDKIQYPEKEVT